MKNILVEGHRGYCAEYPENTLVSYEAAIELGVDCFEFDIWLSKDKVPVLMHDGNARRTCGVDKDLRDMTLAQIKELEPAYTAKFGDKFVRNMFERQQLRPAQQFIVRRYTFAAVAAGLREVEQDFCHTLGIFFRHIAFGIIKGAVV